MGMTRWCERIKGFRICNGDCMHCSFGIMEEDESQMAQLYKMTLYVCDLNDDLSLDEIKTEIKERALDGAAINCICRFADEKVGKRIAWNDDVDINRINCPTEAWERYFE